MVATSLPTGSRLFCCSCCSWTFFSWMPEGEHAVYQNKITCCAPITYRAKYRTRRSFCFYLTSRQHCQTNRYPDSPMRMADSRSLLASLTGFDSPLPPSLCPARCEGAAGGGRSGGGGPGGGGTMRGPGGGTGGSGKPWPACKTPLCGVGGNAPGGKPKAVWADGMGGPGVWGGGPELVERKRIMFLLKSDINIKSFSDYANHKQTYL